MSKKEIFVFGSNLRGAHGKGAALFAKKNHGAVYGQGRGLQGNSYAIPTKGFRLEVLPLTDIRFYVHSFLLFAEENPDIIALGYDQKVFVDSLEDAIKDNVEIVRLAPFKPEIYKSSKLRVELEL